MRKLTIIGLLLLAAAIVALLLYRSYDEVYRPLALPDDGLLLYVPSGSEASDVAELLDSLGLLESKELCMWLMERKNYRGEMVEAGKYRIAPGTSLNGLINSLRGGRDEEMIKITFHHARTLPELAGAVARYIEADSSSLAAHLKEPTTAAAFGFNAESFITMFLPDTYFMEWDSDAAAFTRRMAKEYKAFWTDERLAKAKALKLSQSEVSILASIVEAEQLLHVDERPTIAGLYLNRLRRGMKLQSDPTVIFALGDFSIRRVLTTHLTTESPYNTYRNVGLPPGPIRLPQKSSIDAVLNAEEHGYLYMCAREDFSGYHAFAKNLAEHNRNAQAYRMALNKKKIYR